MTNTLYIDNIDIYATYGVFVVEGGYKSLVAYPPLKEPEKNDWAEMDGIEVDLSEPKLDTRDFSIQFGALPTADIAGLITLLKNGAFHSFIFAQLGTAKYLRLVSNNAYTGTLNSLSSFSLEFADDFPLFRNINNLNFGGRNLILNSKSHAQVLGFVTFPLSDDMVSGSFMLSFDYECFVEDGIGISLGFANTYDGSWKYLDTLPVGVGHKVMQVNFTRTNQTHFVLYTNQSTIYSNVKLELGNVSTPWTNAIEDITPQISIHSDYVYQSPLSTVTPYTGYKVDGKELSDYGVVMLEGTNASILKAGTLKKNQTVNVKSQHGATYDGGRVKLQSNDVTLKCGLRATDLQEFWRNYNALIYDLTRENERTLEVASLGTTNKFYYKSATVEQFFPDDTVWCIFSLNLVFTLS